MIRRLKKDVLKKLPKKLRQQVYIDVSENDKKVMHTMLSSMCLVSCSDPLCRTRELLSWSDAVSQSAHLNAVQLLQGYRHRLIQNVQELGKLLKEVKAHG